MPEQNLAVELAAIPSGQNLVALPRRGARDDDPTGVEDGLDGHLDQQERRNHTHPRSVPKRCPVRQPEQQTERQRAREAPVVSVTVSVKPTNGPRYTSTWKPSSGSRVSVRSRQVQGARRGCFHLVGSLQ